MDHRMGTQTVFYTNRLSPRGRRLIPKHHLDGSRTVIQRKVPAVQVEYSEFKPVEKRALSIPASVLRDLSVEECKALREQLIERDKKLLEVQSYEVVL